MKHLNNLRTFFLCMLIDRVTNCHDKAMRRLIAAEADSYYHNMLANHYQMEASKVDPTTDWWSYAHLRDKQQEQEDKVKQASEYCRKCAQRVSHLRDQLAALRTKQFVS